MNFRDFVEQVDKAKSKNPIWFELDSDAIPDTNSINVIADTLNVKLPKEYIDFLLSYGGGYFAFSIIYSADPTSEFYLLNKNLAARTIRKNHVIFSENGSGDYYGFLPTDGICDNKVHFWDHETGIWKKTEDQNFLSFLKRIALTNY